MNYQKHYDLLISSRLKLQEERLNILNERRKQNPTERTNITCFERHHITPKCLDGLNDKSNIIILTPREHYIAHWLLSKIYPTNNKLLYAMWRMLNDNQNNHVSRNSKKYELSRINFIRSITGRKIIRRKGYIPFRRNLVPWKNPNSNSDKWTKFNIVYDIVKHHNIQYNSYKILDRILVDFYKFESPVGRTYLTAIKKYGNPMNCYSWRSWMLNYEISKIATFSNDINQFTKFNNITVQNIQTWLYLPEIFKLYISHYKNIQNFNNILSYTIQLENISNLYVTPKILNFLIIYGDPADNHEFLSWYNKNKNVKIKGSISYNLVDMPSIITKLKTLRTTRTLEYNNLSQIYKTWVSHRYPSGHKLIKLTNRLVSTRSSGNQCVTLFNLIYGMSNWNIDNIKKLYM